MATDRTSIINDPEFVARVMALVQEIATERAAKQRAQALSRPILYTSNTDATDRAPLILEHLVNVPSLYQQHGGVLVRHRDEGKGKIEVLGKDELRAEITKHIEFRNNPDKDQKSRLPHDVVTYLLSSDRDTSLPQFREFRFHAYAPFFSAEGEFIYQSGYHEGTQTILSLPPDLENMQPIASEPTDTQIELAVKFLTEDLLGDFIFHPFEASRAHMLAALITPFVRPLIGGLVPQIGIAAAMNGSGKSLLAKIVGLVARGEDQPMMSAKVDFEEQRKTITSILENGQPIAVWDNVKVGDVVGGSPLATLLTTAQWQDRLLKTNDARTWPNRCLWIITGNNLRFTGELARRTLVVQIRKKDDRIYRHVDPDLETWIKKNRVQIIRAIGTLVQHWLVTGRVPFETRVKPSFEGFSRVVGGILQACNLEQGFLTETKNDGGNDTEVAGSIFTGDPNEPVDSMEDDPDAPMREFVSKWATSPGYGFHTAAQLYDYMPKSWNGKIVTSSKPGGQLKQFSMYLSKRVGRVFSGYRVERHAVSGEENKYRIVSIKDQS